MEESKAWKVRPIKWQPFLSMQLPKTFMKLLFTLANFMSANLP